MTTNKMHRLLLLGCLISFFSGCGIPRLKLNKVVEFYQKKKIIPLFIQMPENNKNFSQLSTVLYEELVYHFERLGYNLSDSANNSSVLRLVFDDIYPERKFVSPDVLLFSSNMRLRCVCYLYNKQGVLLFTEQIAITKVFGKPRQSAMDSAYVEYYLRAGVQKMVYSIEQKMRPLFLKLAI